MRKMSAKPSDISDPAENDDPVAFISLMAGYNKTDLRRLAELVGVSVDVLAT